jgi:hypothetical protein
MAAPQPGPAPCNYIEHARRKTSLLANDAEQVRGHGRHLARLGDDAVARSQGRGYLPGKEVYNGRFQGDMQPTTPTGWRRV